MSKGARVKTEGPRDGRDEFCRSPALGKRRFRDRGIFSTLGGAEGGHGVRGCAFSTDIAHGLVKLPKEQSSYSSAIKGEKKNQECGGVSGRGGVLRRRGRAGRTGKGSRRKYRSRTRLFVLGEN